MKTVKLVFPNVVISIRLIEEVCNFTTNFEFEVQVDKDLNLSEVSAEVFFSATAMLGDQEIGLWIEQIPEREYQDI
jgi:hypothetical protein